MPGTFLALTEVNEMLDVNESVQEQLKQEIRDISGECKTLNKQYRELEKMKKGPAKEIERKLLDMEKEKIKFESLYNSLLTAKQQQEKQAEIRKLNQKERKEKLKLEIQEFLTEMKNLRESI